MARIAKKTLNKTGAKKTLVKKVPKKISSTPKLSQPIVMASQDNTTSSRNYTRLAIVGLLLLVLAFLLWRNKGLFIAAMVNNQPVWRLSLDSQLEKRYGDQILDEMVGELLIRQAAANNKIIISKSDVDAKVSEIGKTLNGKISLQDALAQQGDTIEAFRQRVELQLMLEKLTAGQIQVSDQEVTEYIDKNREVMTATDEAGLRQEAKSTLTNQKQNTVLRQYFADLKSKAKVFKFL